MDNPQSDSSSPLRSGDPSSPSRSIVDPTDLLQEARRSQRLAEARNLSRRYVLLSATVSLIPLPLLDITAVLAIQVKLVHDLARIYETPFESRLVKPLLTSLLSCGVVSGGSVALIALGMASPPLRTLVGGGLSGGMAGTTLATSEIFIRHFENGGSLEDFAHKNPLITAPSSGASSSTSTRTEDPLQPFLIEDQTFEDRKSPNLAPVPSDPQTAESKMLEFHDIFGIGTVYSNRLFSHGIHDMHALAALDPQGLKEILGQRVSLATASDFIRQARTLVTLNSS
jgi:uncharacterized protein (DUF697 family)